MIRAAQAMVKCIEMEGIKVVFGYPGAAICPFYDELYRSDIKHVLVRHEAKAATCTTIGLNAYETCTRCDYLSASQVRSPQTR